MAKKFSELVFYPNAKKGKPEESEGTLDLKNGMPSTVKEEKNSDQMEITHRSGRKEKVKVHMTGSDYHIVKNKDGAQYTVDKKGNVLHGHGNANEGYNDNRTGFAKRQREDDEYHVPDPVGQTHKIGFSVSKDGGEKHSRTVTISNSTKSKDQATASARAHLEKQGYKIHEEVIVEDVYKDAEGHLDKADKAQRNKDMFSHHMHMADHHDSLSQWHDSKGRSDAAEKHANKAADHEERAHAIKQRLKEQTDLTEEHFVHVSDGSKYGDKPNKKDTDHVMAGAKKHKGEFDGVSDKGAFFKFKSHDDAKAFKKHVDSCPGRSCHADLHEQAPVAPVPDRKYIKGTPENKAYKATKKPINGHPTNVKEDKKEETMLNFTSFVEALKGNQHKIDKNKNGKVDSHDFKLLRKEETEAIEEARVNGREYASQGVMHPDHAKMDIHKPSNQHVDFYATKTGDKMQGKVLKNDGKEVHIKAHKELGDGKLHKFKVTANLPKPQNEEVEIEENAFDWKSKKSDASSGRYEIKRENGRTVVTRKYNPDTGMSTGTDDNEPEAQKRGRGRPAGSKNRGSAK